MFVHYLVNNHVQISGVSPEKKQMGVLSKFALMEEDFNEILHDQSLTIYGSEVKFKIE